ncbi:MAG: hypothetical protein LBS45_11725 [Synergistaceae bacterium]|nr:hypothetical protein [Synergistaceae bacterium]
MKKKPLPLRVLFLAELFLLCAAGFVGVGHAAFQPGQTFNGLDGEGAVIVSADETRETSLFLEDERGGISVYIAAACDDPALEAAIRVIAQDRLRTLDHVTVVESMDEAAVLLSFFAFRTRVEEKDQIVYSFAYGAPDTEFVDGAPVSLPRYIYHDAALTRPDELASSINGNIAAADADFIRRLR